MYSIAEDAITLSDPTPVQKTYYSIPYPVQEVEEYLQDLLSHGWITKIVILLLAHCVCQEKRRKLATVLQFQEAESEICS